MAVIAYNKFLGEIPQLKPHLLPPQNAQEATGCDFGNGALVPLRGGLRLNGMLSNPVRGIYTEDGINFYTWTNRTFAFRSPVIDDTHYRVYFLQPGGSFNATTRPLNRTTGGSPLSTTIFKAGVPRPTTAPSLSTVDRTTLRDYANASLSAEVWWEYGGKPYDRQSVSLTQVSAWRSYTFVMPTASEDVPAGASVVASLKITDGATTIASVVTRETASGRSASLPGGFEVSLAKADSRVVGNHLLSFSWGVVETRAYTYTYVNTWSEEGATAPPALIDVNYMQDVKVRVTAGTFTGYRPFSVYRVYRTYGSGSSYIETAMTGTAPDLFDSNGDTAGVGKVLESTNWTPPPDTLQGLELMPNGWFAAFNANTLYMSEPYRPHAWPYNMTFPSTIRGIKAGSQSLVVTTLDGVYVVTGGFPSAAQQVKVNLPQGGSSQVGMTAIDGGVCYASPDGLVIVAGASATLAMSQKLFRRLEWQRDYGDALRMQDLYLAFHDGCLIGSSRSMGKGFSIRMDEDAGNYSRVSGGYDAMFYLPTADSIYYSVGADVYQLRAGDAGTMSWWGRDWIFQHHITFGAGFIRCNGAVTLTIYADGTQVHQATLSATGHFRLPPLPRALRWSVKLSGSNEVQELYLAQTMGELKSV